MEKHVWSYYGPARGTDAGDAAVCCDVFLSSREFASSGRSIPAASTSTSKDHARRFAASTTSRETEIAAGAKLQLKAWRGVRTAEEQAYYIASAERRFTYRLLSLGLAAFLAIMCDALYRSCRAGSEESEAEGDSFALRPHGR